MENNSNESLENQNTKSSKFIEFLKNGWDLVKFAIVALIIVVPIRMWIAQPFIVSGESMFPTFSHNDYLIVDEISYILGNASRGDVAIFKYPGDTDRFFIKRIIGLPNEKIIVKNNEVIIFNKESPDGIKLDEPYINESFTNEIGEYSTSDNEYFTLGDNRNRSLDSRSWGILKDDFLIGKAFLRLLPINAISYLPGKSAY